MESSVRKVNGSATVKFPDDAPEGSVRAVFSTFGIVDRDGDVIDKGALKDGTPIKLCSWGHNWGDLAVGKGVIRVTDSEAIFDGKFFLDTEAGLETYKTVKNLGELQEWSWGFSVKEWEYEEKDGKPIRVIKTVEPFEVSPVLIGANQKTSTLEIKQRKDSNMTEAHTHTATTNTNEYVTVDDSSTFSLPDETKEVSSESINAILNELAGMVSEVMGMEGARSWDADLLLSAMSMLEWYETVYVSEEKSNEQDNIKELIKNLFSSKADLLLNAGLTLIDEADEEKSTSTFADQGDRLLDDLEAYLDRAKSLAELRSSQNRGWSKANSERLVSISKAFEDAAAAIEEVLDTDSESKSEEVNDQNDNEDTSLPAGVEEEAPEEKKSRKIDAFELHQKRLRTLETGETE